MIDALRKVQFGIDIQEAHRPPRSDAIPASLEYQPCSVRGVFSSTVLAKKVLEQIKTEHFMIVYHLPINVDAPQCGTVGVNSTTTWFPSTSTCGADTTANCSNVKGCSGSVIERMCSKRVEQTENTSWRYYIDLPKISSESIGSSTSFSLASESFLSSSIQREYAFWRDCRPGLVAKIVGFVL